jgi:signal transduction histidine kinase
MFEKDIRQNVEIRCRKKSGEEIWVNAIGRLTEYQGEVAGLGSFRDITERKRLEEQLAQSQLLASLGEMTAGIAHEVNNPLSSIMLYCELIDREAVPSRVRKDLAVISSEAKRAANIMKDLLVYTRRAEPASRRLDLHRIVRKVLEMRRYQEKVKNIDISLNMAPGQLRVAGNGSQLTQLLMNLVVNAEEAMAASENDDKRLVITTGADGGWARITIADNGTGISEDTISQVFFPFFSTKPTGAGTGLGLSTCHGIVTAHGGLIRAENNEMGGASLIVELPLA